MDADTGFSHSYRVAMCPQVEPDVDHYRSTTHAVPSPFSLQKGTAPERRVRASLQPSAT